LMPRITVGLRLRPTSPGVEDTDSTITCNQQTNNGSNVEINVGGTKHDFCFDKLYDYRHKQEDVFSTCTIPIIEDALEGYNGCIFAYGQTGAGKTYTMSGPDGDYSQRGLCMRAVSYIFERAKSFALNVVNGQVGPESISVRLSILEIYNESVIDLLVEPIPSVNSITPAVHTKLTIVETQSGVMVPGLHIMPISDEDEAFQILNEAQANRAVAEHQLNMKSSRSHVIYTYYITRTKLSDEAASDAEVTQSKLHFVDLAGSERMNKTGSTGAVMKEANYINKSLSYLEQVVIALTQSKRDHIPYRQSKLTYMLKDSLGGNCNTFMIACVWPHSTHSWETLSTLRFAARMKCIETHPVRNSLLNKDPPANAKLLQQVDLLKKELVLRDAISGRDPWLPELTRPQKFKVYRQCVQLMTSSPSPAASSSDDLAASVAQMVASGGLSVQSLSHLYLIIGTLKAAVWDLCRSDPEEVSKAIKSTILSRNSSYADKLTDFLVTPLSSSSTTTSNNPEILLPTVTTNPIKSPSAGPIVTSPSRSDAAVALGVEDDGGSGMASEEVFQQFKLGLGKVLNDSYEEAKETLRLSKNRQKEIITMLNNQKALIDDLTTQLATAVEINGLDTPNSKLKAELEEAKRSYRSAHMEMKLCKDQVTETQSLKKRAMASLLHAFTDYQQQQRSGGGSSSGDVS